MAVGAMWESQERGSVVPNNLLRSRMSFSLFNDASFPALRLSDFNSVSNAVLNGLLQCAPEQIVPCLA